ncbi:MAG: PilN domain-containing protein [Thermoleophilia bacterium]
MPHVNLVPAEEKRRELRRQLVIIPIAGAMLLLGGLSGSYYFYSNQLGNAQQEVDSYKSLNAKQAKDVAELKKYEDLKNQKQTSRNAVAALYDARFRWSRMFDDLSFIIPGELSLTSIKGLVPGAAVATSGATTTSTQQQQDLTFEGFARSMPDVAIFMVRLALIPSLKDVTLNLAEVQDLHGQRPIHFVINAMLNNVGETQQPAVAPTTGEAGPSQVTPTGTGTTTTGTGTNGSRTSTAATTGTTR